MKQCRLEEDKHLNHTHALSSWMNTRDCEEKTDVTQRNPPSYQQNMSRA